MIIIEFIVEIIARLFVEFIFHGIILGIYRLFKRIINFVRTKFFGTRKFSKTKKILEDKLAYKKIELLENINPNIKIGFNGDVLEVIDKDTIFAEFLGKNGKQIEYNDNLVFEIKMNQFKLKQ